MRFFGPLTRLGVVGVTVAAAALVTASSAYANVPLTQVSNDPYADAQAQHQTQVGPDTFQSGNTIVSVFQSGRVFGGGVGFAVVMSGFVIWILQWVALSGWLLSYLGFASLFLGLGGTIATRR